MSTDEAWVYEKIFVPALFGPWAETVADDAKLSRGDRVLDVACGTGVLARAAAARVRPGGMVVGLDLREDMLVVAQSIAPELEWQQGPAESLPFSDGRFDAVVSQFALMFFGDRHQALREMLRVLRPGGRLTVAVWGPLDRAPGFAALVALLERLFGQRVADALRAPFCLGDARTLVGLFHGVGVPSPTITTRLGHARFLTLADWIDAEARGWLGLDEAQTKKLQRDAKKALGAFVSKSGRVELETSAHVVTSIARSL